MHRLAEIFGWIILTLVIVGGAVVGANYSGVCVPEFRYLSDAEKVGAAVAYVLDRGFIGRKPDAANYESVEDYLGLVDGCCRVDSVDGSGLTFPNRYIGNLSSYVWIAKVPRSTAEAASQAELRTILLGLPDREHFYIAVSNCGRAWDPTD